MPADRKSKINIDTEERSDFDNMMNDVENEVEEQQAEDGLVNRVPELKQLSEDIDKATNTFINATLELESAILQYQRAEIRLGGTVTTIGKKVDTINQHIDKVMENAPIKLKVSVNVNDADWHKIEELFAKERKWMTSQMQMHIREVNSMFVVEWKKVRERYSRHILLQDVGLEGQEKLLNAKVLIIGAGGLGSQSSLISCSRATTSSISMRSMACASSWVVTTSGVT